jgi:nucleotide-binding universal stress UspA family protein
MVQNMSTFLVPLDNVETDQESLAFGRHMASTFGARIGLVLANGSTSQTPEEILGVDADCIAGTFVLTVDPGPELLNWLDSLEQPVVVLDTDARAPGGQRISPWIASHAGPTVTTLAGDVDLTSGAISRMLVPLDGSAESEQVLNLATSIALRTGATIGLVRIIADHDPEATDTACENARVLAERHEARSYLDTVARRLRKEQVHVTWEVRIGNAGEEIARASATTAANLILMASNHYGDPNAAGILSVTSETIGSARLPVIVARITSG